LVNIFESALKEKDYLNKKNNYTFPRVSLRLLNTSVEELIPEPLVGWLQDV
jgi:hypothetical protein